MAIRPALLRPLARGAAGAGLAACLLGTPLAAAAQTPPQPAPLAVNRDARIMADFEARVKAYAAMHEKHEATLTPLAKEATPEAIDEHQQGLARLIAQSRAKARPGDIFTSETRALFRRRMAAILASPSGPAIRAAILDEDPGRVRLTVNGHYPDSVPLSTVPTEVLELLPRLPEQLEYHFVGPRLVLVDIHARIVVDLIENALPR